MSVRAQRSVPVRAMVLLAGTACAVLLRSLVGGPRVAESIPAALLGGALLVGVAYATGWRPGRMSVGAVIVGMAGAVVLVAVPAAVRGLPLMWHTGSLPAAWMVWAAALVVVVVGEEVMLRGVLFDALVAERGVAVAVAVTSTVFGVMHVPLYGWIAVPLDIAVGVWLSGLRLLTNGIAAPVVCHLTADAATLWLL